MQLTAREFDLLRHLVGARRDRLLARPAAQRRLGLVLRRPVDGHRARAAAPREGGGRPDAPPAARDGVGRRLPLGAAGGAVRMSDQVAIVLIAAAWSGAVGVVGLAVGCAAAAQLAAVAARRRRAGRGHRRRRRGGRHGPGDVPLRPRLLACCSSWCWSPAPSRSPSRCSPARPSCAPPGRCARTHAASATAGGSRRAGGGPAELQAALRGADPHQRAARPSPASARPGSRSPAASWSPGSRTTSAPRWRACGR